MVLLLEDQLAEAGCEEEACALVATLWRSVEAALRAAGAELPADAAAGAFMDALLAPGRLSRHALHAALTALGAGRAPALEEVAQCGLEDLRTLLPGGWEGRGRLGLFGGGRGCGGGIAEGRGVQQQGEGRERGMRECVDVGGWPGRRNAGRVLRCSTLLSLLPLSCLPQAGWRRRPAAAARSRRGARWCATTRRRGATSTQPLRWCAAAM